ncbi:integrase domain-containing protein [Escherichia coli]|uniref:integrase domain-containing protein n=1 Tax=Escherichia coli TaxID=562 RepID=UPI000CFA60FC|nr:integrase domain-containing protein [Escherichia coli]PQP28089.1 integrase [Escherichia coli]
MAKNTKLLTPATIKSLQKKSLTAEKDLFITDGDGLELVVKAGSASALWRFRCYKPHTKKRAMLSLGAYPEISIADARRIKDEYRSLVANGTDPKEHREKQRRDDEIRRLNTFQRVAEEWFEVKRGQNLAANTLRDIWRSLERHVLPPIGHRPITELVARDFIEALKPVSAQGKADTVRRLAQRINEVMYYAVNIGLIPANPAAQISKAFNPPVVKHMPTIRPDELPEFMQKLATARAELQTRLVIEWQLLTICRPCEAAGAQWSEIDADARVWRISAGRLKQRREHIVPLNNRAMAILEAMRPISGHRKFVFPHNSDPMRGMHQQTANAAIRRMGYTGKLVAHGLRSVASTALNEQGFPPDVIEAALSHLDKDTVRRAYNRSTYLEQRRPLMAWWGDFIEQAATGSLSATGGFRGLKVVGE